MEIEYLYFLSSPHKKEAMKGILNSDKANANITSDEMVEKQMSTLMRTQIEVFKKYSNDETFRKNYQDFIFDVLWSDRGRIGRKNI